MKKIRVLVVDDSALIRQILTQAINISSDMEVIGTAEDPFVAREKIKELNPDVITLDVEMPKMDGISFLSNLMRLRPMPVVMVSTLTTKASDVTLNALELGAIDYIAKPNSQLSGNIGEFAREVQEKIRIAAAANVSNMATPTQAPERTKAEKLPLSQIATARFNHFIVIGASTGGTEAIKEVLMGLPANCPPVLIAQHIPANFSASFAKRLNENCPMRVVQAEANQLITAGTAYLAPGDSHLRLTKIKDKYYCKLDTSEKVNRHRPSVEVLFDSVTNVVKNRAVVAILTGMGADGAEALLRMRQAGCHTIAQDEASSVVWGMPGSAVKIGAAVEVVTLKKIAAKLMKLPRPKSGERHTA